MVQWIDVNNEEKKSLSTIMKLTEVTNEYEAIKREKELSEQNLSLEYVFYTCGKHAMLSAKFYHECQMQRIPCVLDVNTQYGEVDAIIEIKDKYIIIEFKTTKCKAKSKLTYNQLEKYAKHLYPVVLLYDANLYASLLIYLQNEILETDIYMFENYKFKQIKNKDMACIC